MTQQETKPSETPLGPFVGPTREGMPDAASAEPESGAAEAEQLETGEFQPPVPAEPDFSQVRSLLTEPVPAGMGEVLVTDIWAPPLPPEAKIVPKAEREPEDPWVEGQRRWHSPISSYREPKPEEPPEDPQRAWETRHELRELGLLRERPAISYDGRIEQYWNQVRDALEKAPQAIVDPYTDLVASFADIDAEEIGEHRRGAREYGRRAESLLELGRAYISIGRLKAARGVFKTAAKAEPYHPVVWWHLGVSHLFARANRDAADALQHAVDQSPGDFRPEMALGLARYHLKDYAAAEEHFRRLAGSTGPRAAARSLLTCSLRMQGKWDGARVEQAFLRDSTPDGWGVVAQQCLACIERGENKREGVVRARRRATQMLKALAAAGTGGVWLLYARARDLFQDQAPWAALPLFLVALVLVRSLRGVSGREQSGEFGNSEQGLPCWQASTWMRPRRSEF